MMFGLLLHAHAEYMLKISIANAHLIPAASQMHERHDCCMVQVLYGAADIS